MTIHLDGLAGAQKPESNNDFPLIPEGKQFVKIIDAEVKSNDKNKWLNVTFENATGSRMYDRVFVTANPHVQYKLQRFISACNIPLSGSLELEDLALLVKGREMYVDVKHAENDYYTPPKMQAEVDIFVGDIFYRVEDENPTPAQPVVEDAPEQPTPAGNTSTEEEY